MTHEDNLRQWSKRTLLEMLVQGQKRHDTETKNTLGEILNALIRVENKGAEYMEEVTGQVQSVMDVIKAEAEALAVRIETKIADTTKAMDQTEAAPILAMGAEIAAGLRGMLSTIPPPVDKEPDEAEPVV